MKAVVLSAHLDDAVMSIGATIHSLRRRGCDVVLLTAFAGDPERPDRTSYWDAKRGLTSKSEAQAIRREEDAAAAAVLDAAQVCLPFDDIAYLAPRDPDVVWKAMEPHLADADIVLAPGWPLTHPDHRHLAAMVIQGSVPGQVLFYQELPYGAQPAQVIRRRLRGRRAATITHALGEDLNWRRTLTTADDFAAKRVAVACYAGELAALGRDAKIAGWYDRLVRQEVVGHCGHPSGADIVFGTVQ